MTGYISHGSHRPLPNSAIGYACDALGRLASRTVAGAESFGGRLLAPRECGPKQHHNGKPRA